MGMNVFPQSSGFDLSIYKKDNMPIVYDTSISANTLTTLLSVSGKMGFFNFISGTMGVATTDFAIKITVDGQVLYYAGTTGGLVYFVGTKDFLPMSVSPASTLPFIYLSPLSADKIIGTAAQNMTVINYTDGTKSSTVSNIHGLILSSQIFFNSTLLVEIITTDTNSRKANFVIGYKTLS